MDGSRCADLEDLKKDEYYVAAGAERFKNVPYGITQGGTSIWNTSPRLERRGVTLPPIGQTSKQERRAYNSRAVIRSRNPSDRGDTDQSDQKSEKSNQSVQSLPNNRNPRIRQNQTFVGYERQKTRAKKPSETDATPQQLQQQPLPSQRQPQQPQQPKQQRQRELSQKEKTTVAAAAETKAAADKQKTNDDDEEGVDELASRQPTAATEASVDDVTTEPQAPNQPEGATD